MKESTGDCDSESESNTDNSNIATTSFQASLASFAFVQGTRTPQRVQGDKERATDHKELRQSKIKRSSEGSAIDESDGQISLQTKSSIPSGPSPSPKKRRRVRGYAAPEIYAHLRDLQDILTEDLDVIFCGINPGQKSAEIGHHFGHPTNHFWGCLHESGLTSERLKPEEDHTLPERFSLGLTNLVDRATAEQNELSIDEQIAGVPALLKKVAKYRPRILCFIGLGIARTVHAQLPLFPKTNRDKVEKPKIGLQAYKMVYDDKEPRLELQSPRETIFYAIPSTSARVVQPQRSGKVQIFSQLKSSLELLKESKLDTTSMHIIVPPQESLNTST